jgi:hypothetical protein
MLFLLGILDMISASVLVLAFFGIIWKVLIIGSAVYLGIKGIIFIKDIASIFDLLAAACLILSLMFTLPKIIFIILALILAQKAFFSFFG